MNDLFSIRRAKREEAGYLTDLAARAKAYWPYDREYLELARSVTRVTADDILTWPVLVATGDPGVLGFAVICEVKGERLLDHIWVDPPFIGKGVGLALFRAAVQAAAGLGWSEFSIVSDPYAEKFYLKQGARRVGERASKVKPSLYLPVLSFEVSRAK